VRPTKLRRSKNTTGSVQGSFRRYPGAFAPHFGLDKKAHFPRRRVYDESLMI